MLAKKYWTDGKCKACHHADAMDGSDVCAPCHKPYEGFFALNSKEWIRCCASCERVYHVWMKGKWGWKGACPTCGFASYGARFVYGDRRFIYVIYRMIKDYFIKREGYKCQ